MSFLKSLFKRLGDINGAHIDFVDDNGVGKIVCDGDKEVVRFNTTKDAILGEGDSEYALSHSPSRTLFNLPAPVILAPSGSVAANGALTLGTSLTHTFSGGCWMYFPAGAVYAGSVAGLFWVIMSSATAGTIYDNVNNGYIDRPATATPISAAGPGAFTGITGEIDVCKFDVPNGLLTSGDALRLAFAFTHTNSANNKTYRIKAGVNSLINPVWTTSDGWNVEMRCYCVGPDQVVFPQGWVPATDGMHNIAAYFVGANRTVGLTANRAVATEVIRLMGVSCVYFPDAT